MITAGISGWVSSQESDSIETPTWRRSMRLEEYGSAVLSCTQCDVVIFREPDPKSKSREILRDRPLTMWQRPLWQVVGAAPSSTQEAGPTSTSNDKKRVQ